MKKISRRDFLRASAVMASGLILSPEEALAKKTGTSDSVKAISNENECIYDAKGLPTVVLGKTGVTIPRMAFGLGSRFCTIKSEEEADNILRKALDNGLYYWDTASVYSNADGKIISESRIGNVVKENRKRIFLSTKISNRDPYEAMRSIELSMRRMETDHFDILMVHDVHSL